MTVWPNFSQILPTMNVTEGLFIWEKVLPVSEKTFRIALLFCSYGTVFPLSGKLLNKSRSYGTNIFNKRDLGTRENSSSHMNPRLLFMLNISK